MRDATAYQVVFAGGKTDGDDVAQILKAAWRETRSSVMRGNGVAEFYFRQYLFACQARLLFKLNRPTEVQNFHTMFISVCIVIQAQFWHVVQTRQLWAFAAWSCSFIRPICPLVRLSKQCLS